MKSTPLTLLVLGLAATPYPILADHDHARHDDGAGSASFVENRGQWPEPVLFRTGASGAALFLESSGWTWSKYEDGASDRMHDIAQLSPSEQAALRFHGHAWRMRFVDPAPQRVVHGTDRSAGYHNYFIGKDPRNWRSHVGMFSGVRYDQVWTGIDIVLKQEQGNLKYDVMVQPGADPGIIGLRYEGLDDLRLTKDGVLVMRTSVGELSELAPVAFYGDARGGAVPCAFVLDGDVVGFRFPSGFDASRPLVIDPLLIAGTYSGATGQSNYGHCAAYDDSGNIYTAGRNFGPTYPVTMGAFQSAPGGGGTDISLSKYVPDGSELIWASYLGGSQGENPHSLIANADGELIVLGSTSSADYPVTAQAYDATVNDQDICITHISADGTSLIGSTFLGGSGSDGTNTVFGNYGEAYRGEVYLDAVGNILLASFSSSTDFPTTSGAFQTTHGGAQDGVVAMLDPTCSQLMASTYLGGSGSDAAMGLRIANNGDIVVNGSSPGNGFPIPTTGYMPDHQGGEQDAFVVKLSSDLSTMSNGTYFGTSGTDRSYFLDLDSEDNVWIYGQTTGSVPIFPEGTYGQQGGEVFVAKLSPDLEQALVTTMIPGQLAPVAFLVDVCDNVYISGYAASGALPTTPDALYTSGSFYLASFSYDMAGILFGTYYGGSHVDGGTSRFDKNGIVYQGVCSGGQSMQSTPWAYAPTNQVAWDIAVFKIDFETAGVQANITSSSMSGCVPADFELTATGRADIFYWDLGNGTPVQTGEQISVSYEETGTYLVRLIGVDSLSCNIADTTYITLNVYDPATMTAMFEPLVESSCDGFFLQLENSSVGGDQYAWSFGDGATSTAFEPVHEYDAPGTYEVELVVRNTVCADTSALTVPVSFTTPTLPFNPGSPVAICPGPPATLDAGPGFDSYLWSTGNAVQQLTVVQIGDYDITVTDGSCSASATITVIQAPAHPPTPDAFTCGGRSIPIAPAFPVSSIVWDNGSDQAPLFVSQSGVYGFSAVDQYGCPVEDEVRVVEIPLDRADGLVPNVFTPNNDQKNDRFEVVGEGIEDFHMEVYDRWGMMMFETANQTNGWNGGLDNGLSAPVPDGTYYYIVDFKDRCSDEPMTTLKGHVTLLR
ncbi:MAG: gliding motility-associated C-terminal domain-containing protein [Flavobacteriales bacterium]